MEREQRLAEIYKYYLERVCKAFRSSNQRELEVLVTEIEWALKNCEDMEDFWLNSFLLFPIVKK